MDGLVRAAELPWIPFRSEEIYLKLCKANTATGEMVILVRLEPGAILEAHYHHGIVVLYTISGNWRYRDSNWAAGPGDVIVEPAGSSHTTEVLGDKPVEAFLYLSGPLEFHDEHGSTLSIENAATLHGRYLAHCALHRIPVVDVT